MLAQCWTWNHTVCFMSPKSVHVKEQRQIISCKAKLLSPLGIVLISPGLVIHSYNSVESKSCCQESLYFQPENTLTACASPGGMVMVLRRKWNRESQKSRVFFSRRKWSYNNMDQPGPMGAFFFFFYERTEVFMAQVVWQEQHYSRYLNV